MKIELSERELDILLNALYIYEAQRIAKSQVYDLIKKIDVARLAASAEN